MTAEAAIGLQRRDASRAAGDSRVVLIVAAMPAELRPLLARMRNRRPLPSIRPRAYSGTLGVTPVIAGCTGEGARAARSQVEALLAQFPARALIGLGTAGGLSPALAPGTIVAATAVRDESTLLPPPDPLWTGRLPQEILRGTIVSSSRILCTPAEKAAARTLAPSGLAVVDLESAAWAGVAARHGLPYVVLRAVLDPAEERLPIDLNSCRNAAGHIDRARVVGRLLLHPGAVKPLWGLATRVSACAARLADLVDALVQGSAP